METSPVETLKEGRRAMEELDIRQSCDWAELPLLEGETEDNWGAWVGCPNRRQLVRADERGRGSRHAHQEGNEGRRVT